MHRSWILLATLAIGAQHIAAAQHHATGAPGYPDRTAAIIQQKSYPLLTALEHNAAFNAAPAIQQLKQSRASTFDEASRCKTTACISALFKLTDAEIGQTADALATLYPQLKPQLNSILASGQYATTQTTSDALLSAWKTDTAALNHLIAVYAEAAPAPYPQIDSMEFKPDSKDFLSLARMAAAVAAEEAQPTDTFFTPNLRFALSMLRINDREDAAAFEPMDRGLNAAAIARARSTPWSKYRYSAILIPGIGPDIVGQPISPLGRLHVALAAARFRSGKAPFIIVSGGSVHPAHTRFTEAIEMRSELIDRYDIPAAAILIDPHARHTTTNLRNAVRELIHYRFPLNKPVLITANESQTSNIANPKFADRNRKELGYLPWLSLTRLSKTDIEFMPNKESLRVDALSPLDP